MNRKSSEDLDVKGLSVGEALEGEAAEVGYVERQGTLGALHKLSQVEQDV